jgi:hypothetical protein
MSEALPNTSGASLTNGVWFVFPLGQRTIRAWGSAASGLERIYVDHVVVSERRSASRRSTHEFTIEGEPYSVTFVTGGRFRMQLDCTLARSDIPLKTFEARANRAAMPVRMGLSLAGGVIVGLAILLFHLPVWAGILLIALSVYLQARTHKNGGFKIEEISPPQPESAEARSPRLGP